MLLRLRQQHEPRRAHAIGGENDDPSPLVVLNPVAVDVVGSRRKALVVDGDLAHARPRHQVSSGIESVWPVGEVGARLGSGRAAGEAGAVAQAGGSVADRLGGDGVGSGPPVPPQLVHAGGGLEPDLAEGKRGQREGGLVRVGGVAAEPGDAHRLLHLLVERLQVLVGEGPVVPDVVQGARLEVRRHHAAPVGRVQDGAATDAVVQQRVHVGLVGVDRVVGRALPHVRVRVPLLLLDELPLGLVAGELGGRRPVALLEADD